MDAEINGLKETIRLQNLTIKLLDEYIETCTGICRGMSKKIDELTDKIKEKDELLKSAADLLQSWIDYAEMEDNLEEP